MSSHQEWLAKARQDPEYVKAEKELKPVLDLADAVLNLRMARGWSQKELARRLGIRKRVVARLENGLIDQ